MGLGASLLLLVGLPLWSLAMYAVGHWDANRLRPPALPKRQNICCEDDIERIRRRKWWS